MKNPRVFLSPLVERKLILLLDYLETEWGRSSKQKFIEKFKTSAHKLSMSPLAFPIFSSSKGIRKCVITKQTSLYYRILDDEVEIITLMDNRQDQKSLFKELQRHFANHGGQDL